jgi:hypothetical protein
MYLEKLTVIQMVKEFSAFYVTQRFIAIFKRARLWAVSTIFTLVSPMLRIMTVA